MGGAHQHIAALARLRVPEARFERRHRRRSDLQQVPLARESAGGNERGRAARLVGTARSDPGYACVMKSTLS
jgi:hypothetical protein